MSAPVRFRVLGPISASRGDTPLPLGAPQQRLVLAVLLLAPGHAATVAQLFEAVWGPRPPRTADASLRNSVSRLRAVLGEDIVVSTDGGYALTVTDFDLAEANRLADSARGTADPARRHALLTAASRLWTDEPLAGLDGSFATFQRSRLRDLRLGVVEKQLAVEVERGGGREAIDRLRELCRAHPFREEPHRLLMLALHESGRDREALAVHDALSERLAESLGIDPCAAIATLRESCRAQIPRPAQLPADHAAFTGRDDLTARLMRTLTTGPATVAVLSGLGGVGKTAMAVHVAHRLRHHFPDGQLFADLHGAESEPVPAGVVLARFLRALGVPDAQIPADTDQRSALLASVTAGKRVFMLLDNAHDATQLRPLISAGHHVAVLVTSRSRLSELDGAEFFRVGVLDPAEAHELFRKIIGDTRAESDASAADAVVAACGFLPLAVRIAASRALTRPQWALSELAERLGDTNRRLAELDDGDGSVAAAFALSYAHLDQPLAGCFRWLTAVDLPDFTLPEVAGMLDRAEPEVAIDLESLIDLGLLGNSMPGRYQVHDLVRLFGSERATADECRIAIERLVRHYLALTVAAIDTAHPEECRRLSLLRRSSVPHASFEDRESALEWLNGMALRVLRVVPHVARRHFDSMDAAADLIHSIAYWAWSGPDRQPFIDTATELAEAARRHGNPFAEARARLALLDCLGVWQPHRAEPEGHRVMRLATSCGDDTLHAEACMLLAAAMVNAGDRPREQILDYQSRAIEHFDGTPALRGRAAAARSERALTLFTLGRREEALAESARSVTVLRELDNDGALARALYQHGLALRGAGHVTSACGVFGESLTLARRLQDRPLQMLSVYNLARSHTGFGAVTMAMIYAEQAAAMSAELYDDDKHARSLVILGHCLRRSGSLRRAHSRLSEALEIFERLDRPDARQQRRLLADQLDELAAGLVGS